MEKRTKKYNVKADICSKLDKVDCKNFVMQQRKLL